MPIDHLSKWTPALQPVAVRPTDTSLTNPTRKPTPHRNVHGGNAWSMPSGAQLLRQPQDGATERLSRLSSLATRIHNSLPQEPEDASLTGGTRSLSRRLLGLNVTKAQRKAPDTANLHLKVQLA